MRCCISAVCRMQQKKAHLAPHYLPTYPSPREVWSQRHQGHQAQRDKSCERKTGVREELRPKPKGKALWRKAGGAHLLAHIPPCFSHFSNVAGPSLHLHFSSRAKSQAGSCTHTPPSHVVQLRLTKTDHQTSSTRVILQTSHQRSRAMPDVDICHSLLIMGSA